MFVNICFVFFEHNVEGERDVKLKMLFVNDFSGLSKVSCAGFVVAAVSTIHSTAGMIEIYQNFRLTSKSLN